MYCVCVCVNVQVVWCSFHKTRHVLLYEKRTRACDKYLYIRDKYNTQPPCVYCKNNTMRFYYVYVLIRVPRPIPPRQYGSDRLDYYCFVRTEDRALNNNIPRLRHRMNCTRASSDRRRMARERTHRAKGMCLVLYICMNI